MTQKDTVISLQYLIAIDIVGLVGENARSHTKEDRGCTYKLDVISVRGVENSDGGIPLLLVPEGTLVLSSLLVNDAVILSEERRYVTKVVLLVITLNAYFPHTTHMQTYLQIRILCNAHECEHTPHTQMCWAECETSTKT